MALLLPLRHQHPAGCSGLCTLRCRALRGACVARGDAAAGAAALGVTFGAERKKGLRYLFKAKKRGGFGCDLVVFFFAKVSVFLN